MQEITSVLMESYQAFLMQIATFLPKLIGAVAILILGWIVAKIIRSISIKLMKLIKLDTITEKSGIETFLKDGGVKKSLVEIMGSLFYWLIMLIVILATFNSLGLSVASELFNQIILFIPNIIIAVLVLIFGFFLANFVAQVVVTYLKNIGVSDSEALGKVTQYGIIVFVVSIALTQLNIGATIVTYGFLILFGAACLALALAFGLGGREVAARFLEKHLKEK